MKMLPVVALICTVMVRMDGVAGAAKTSCPAGWTQSNNRCFYFVSTAKNWADAEKNCQTLGANLASVHSDEENHKIQMMITRLGHGFAKAWLGGTDASIEGVWLWSDGTSFNYRHCGYFNNGSWRQHCLQMNYGGDKCWDDVECQSTRPSVCAKKAHKFRQLMGE